MKTETKENAFQIITDVANSSDNIGVINHLQSIYIKTFGEEEEEFNIFDDALEKGFKPFGIGT
mgnify:FL=1